VARTASGTANAATAKDSGSIGTRKDPTHRDSLIGRVMAIRYWLEFRVVLVVIAVAISGLATTSTTCRAVSSSAVYQHP